MLKSANLRIVSKNGFFVTNRKLSKKIYWGFFRVCKQNGVLSYGLLF